jgi:hypothetical protein
MLIAQLVSRTQETVCRRTVTCVGLAAASGAPAEIVADRLACYRTGKWGHVHGPECKFCDTSSENPLDLLRNSWDLGGVGVPSPLSSSMGYCYPTTWGFDSHLISERHANPCKCAIWDGIKYCKRANPCKCANPWVVRFVQTHVSVQTHLSPRKKY